MHGSSTRTTVESAHPSTSGGRLPRGHLSYRSSQVSGAAGGGHGGALDRTYAPGLVMARAGVASSGNRSRDPSYRRVVVARHVRSERHGHLSPEARRDASAPDRG